MAKYKEDIINIINKKLELLDGKSNIVIWGLGEYAEQIAIWTNLLKYKISAYVDTKRRGSFLGCRINTPEDIIWENVEVVVITSYFKGDEIERTLYNMISFSGLIIDISLKNKYKEFYKYESKEVKKIEKNYAQYLKRNNRFYNINRNRKCFILGNGPSINTLDLNRIEKESVVFAVNDFYRQNSQVLVDYYVAADPFYFDVTLFQSYGAGFFEGIKKVEKRNTNMCYFFPVQFVDFLILNGIQWTNSYYFYANRQWENRVDNRIDLTKRIFGRWSVIQYCIQIAIYMGVKEIYLLGCEETGIYGELDNYNDEGYSEYAYNIPEKQLNVLKEYGKKVSIEDMLLGFANIYRGYNEMNNLCNQNDIKLYTCASKTLVKNIEYIDFNDAVENTQ